MSNNNLSLVTSQDLVEELNNRFDAFICIGVVYKDGERASHTFNYSGDSNTCLGLCNRLSFLINDDSEEDRYSDEEG